MHGSRCASQMCWAHCSSGFQAVIGAWGVFGAPRVCLGPLGSCFGWGSVLGGWQEVLPEPRASCQRLYFTAVSLWLFSWEHADLEGRETRTGLGSPSIPWGLAGWGQRLQDGCREVAGPGAGGCQGCLGEVLENETSAPGLDGPLEPVRHTGDGVNNHGVWHRTTCSIQGGRSIPKSLPAFLQLAKCYCLAGAFPYPTIFWS